MFINLLTSNNILEDIFLPLNLRKKFNSILGNEHFNSGFISLSTSTSTSTSENTKAPSLLLGSAMNTNSDNADVDVYFYRYIGFDNKDEYIKKLNNLNEKLSALGNMYLKYNGKIPQPYNAGLTNRINLILNNILASDVRNNKLGEILEKNGFFNLTKDPDINLLIRKAFDIIMELYLVNEPISNSSIEKNFITKLIIWISEYVPRLFQAKINNEGPRVVYYGDIKKHEIYFLIMLSQIGCDVLYINSESDSDYLKVDKASKFSIIKECSIKAHVDFEFKVVQVVKEARAQIKTELQAQKLTGTKENAMIILKRAINIFEDISFPLSKRTGYIGVPSPILPIYFYRYIGFEGEESTAEDEYYNKIFSLDKKLTSSEVGYAKFVNHIPMPLNDEIDEIINKFKNSFSVIGEDATNDKSLLINSLTKKCILTDCKNPLLNKLVNRAFERVLKVYLLREPMVNMGKLENFIYKIVVWINRYYPILFKKNDFSESPKVIFYGDIKAHEVYFLIFLSNIGCDVLFLNTNEEKDKPFKEIDPNEEFSTLIVNNNTEQPQDFPEKERTIRKTTTAFNASQEIERIIYSEDASLFRPWQFEDYMTKPITLKTTYDELKILWREDCKLRPEFKVENNTVYIPNLFAKISGTMEDLEQYWLDYKYFVKSQNTLELVNIPFTEVTYSKQEMYSLAFLLDKKGFVDRESLQNFKLYKFGYLRTSLQNLLIEKLNELLQYNNFNKTMDNNFRLQILMTVITIDENISKLLETFDYPSNIPKLVIYNNSKESFSDEDSIIIAFLNLIGFDIVIFTPTNYNTIEQKLREDVFDKFQLPSIQFDLQIPASAHSENEKSKSIFTRLFGI